MGRVIYYFTFTIREAIRRRYILKNDKENEEILEIILSILEEGIKNYLLKHWPMISFNNIRIIQLSIKLWINKNIFK